MPPLASPTTVEISAPQSPFFKILMSKRLWVVAVLLVIGADGVQAQRQPLCTEAIAAVQDSGAEMLERTRGLRSLIYCDAAVGAALLSEELLGLRSRADVYNMDWLVNNILVARHPLLLEAALELVSDREATAEGRVAAMRLFIEYDNRSYRTTIEDLIQARIENLIQCRLPGVMQHDGRRDMAPLPEDWTSTVEGVLRLIEDDTEERRDVRDAAHCALLLMSIS